MTIVSRREFSASIIGLSLCGLIKPSHATLYPDRSLRIVSLSGAITEIIYELNLQKYLVGVARTLSIEGVLYLNPTHILAE